MITLLSEIHFWTTQEDVIIKHTDYGSFKYYPKKEITDIFQAKKQYCERRNIIYSPHNKRPQKIRDRLKELEEYLVHNKIVCYTWEDYHLRLLLSTGLVANLTVNSRTGDLVNISFDKQLSTKLQVNIICDGVIFGSQVICICNDGHLLGFGGPWKEGWVLEGGPRRRLNYHGEWLAVWGKAGAEHPQPWSPLAKDHQRANLHLYWIGARDPELLAYKKTDGEPLQVIVSKRCGRTLILVEQKVTQRGAVSVEISNFELVGNNLKRVSVTSVPLQTQVSCSALSDNEERLLIGCIDGSLALLDRNRGSTRTVKAAFIPTLSVWHPEGVVVAISNERGQLQYYDTALNCIKTQTLGEDCTPTAIIDLSGYFNMQFSVVSLNWGPKDLILSLEQGPLVIVTHVERLLTFKSIAKRYLNMGKVDKAIKLLISWDFNENSFFVLQKITAALLRRSLTDETAQYLQNALGSFHNSPVPVSSQVRHKYGGQVFSLTRRFFHQLVRASMFETAFLLAVDVGHHDLFMDLHYIAVKIGETEMAAAARAQASALLSRCSSEASNCSRSSCSQCSDTESSSSEDSKSNMDSSKTQNDYLSPITLNPDNILTTDFNQPNPTTYKPVEKETLTKYDYPKLNYTPKATYVKAPQVPPNFTKLTPQTSSINVPPLPFHSTLGIPYVHNNEPNPTNNYSNTLSNPFSISASNHYQTNSPKVKKPVYSAFSSVSVPSANSIKSSFTPINKIPPPPLLNLIPETSSPLPNNIQTSSSNGSSNEIYSTSSSSAKKNQPKVKFSDTVTAFIVPEIKRPLRPPPPPHVTDPQKELADSLPLCHPNEDYLKDFAPVRKSDSEDGEQNSQPKIKVVHFGVV